MARQNLRRLFTAFALLIGVLASAPLLADGIFPDPNLEAVVRAILKQKQIDKPAIEEADLKTIFFLDARGKQIKDLTGLEKCTSLAEVKLSDNAIENLAPLAGLKNIQSLYLAKNQIKDIGPLTNLVKLQYLDLNNNQISSLAGIEKLAEKLGVLYLSGNQIESIDPVGELKKLHSLYLADNKLKSVGALEKLKWTSSLDLSRNQITDLKPLLPLTELRFTFLNGNPLQDLAPLVEMAKKDVAGEQRFAPYWRLYLDVEPLPDPAKAQVEELKSIGVRVNLKAS
jgi:internalin A